MRGLGTDQVISGPVGGLKKLHLMAHTDTQTDMATLRLNRPSRADSVKSKKNKKKKN